MSDILHASPLGKSSQYETEYNPELLFPIPRREKQLKLGLNPEKLPFVGCDVWYAYELSWLNMAGKPLVYVGRFQLPCDSPNLIESKSFKLYLNAFNQSRYDSPAEVQEVMEKDLSQCAGSPVKVTLMTLTELENLGFSPAAGSNVDDMDVVIETYNYEPELLEKGEGAVSETINSHLLKSNCPVTGQPDWGSVIVEYKGEAIDHASFLKYICSFRNHQEFHEQCVERVFIDIHRRFQMEELTVYARYVRRGGLDINPWRSTHKSDADVIRLIRQ